MSPSRCSRRGPGCLFAAGLVLALTALCLRPASAAGQQLVVAVRQSLRADLARAPETPAPLHLAYARQVERFYRAVDFHPAWIGPRGPLPRAATLLHALRDADAEGLRREHFHLAAIERRLGAQAPASLAQLDLLLTDAWCRYALAVNAGNQRLREADRQWHIERRAPEPAALLEHALATESFRAALRSLEPPHAAYRRLRRALARYRRIAEQGGWPEIPAGPAIEPGAHDPRVPLLRRRLLATGDLSTEPDSGDATMDAGLEVAVRRFQQRNGLAVDGIVGRNTRAALNVPVAARIAQIRVNMERWRWLPARLGERYILVNPAAYRLQVFEGGEPVITMKAIIGRATRQTPSLRSRVVTVVIDPYWNVPARLARLDLLPKEQADPGYFRAHGIRVLRGTGDDTVEIDPSTVDWSELSPRNFPYRLRQDPGPGNALGRIKLLFPNRFDVYLHDTPDRDLFECTVRAFSSGCVRVEHAVRLAAFVLRGTGDWNEARLEEAIAAGTTRRLRVADPVPIYIAYLTAWAGRNGTMHFRRDLYRRDEALLRAGL